MKITIDNEEYNLIITKKITTKNIYIRVKENLDIYVTCNTFTSNREILKLIENNTNSLIKMINKRKKKKQKEEFFYYLGKKYDLVYLNNSNITFGDNKVFVPFNFDFDKWYKEKAQQIFQEELRKMYQAFIYDIPFPSSLCIRKMKTRWGVCNTKTHKITLNLELIKKDIVYLDYVIVHELSHLIYPNHSKEFWNCVGNNFKDYKKVRKDLKQDE